MKKKPDWKPSPFLKSDRNKLNRNNHKFGLEKEFYLTLIKNMKNKRLPYTQTFNKIPVWLTSFIKNEMMNIMKNTIYKGQKTERVKWLRQSNKKLITKHEK